MYEGSPAGFNYFLGIVNYIFTTVFAIEAMLKLIAFGRHYWKNSWNVFDFAVVCSSFFDIAMEFLGGSSMGFLRVAPQLARVFRVLRVSRLFRLAKQFEGLQALI